MGWGVGLERLFVAVGRVGGTGAAPAGAGAGRGGLSAGRGAFTRGAGGPLDLGLRPAQAGPDLLGDDLDLGPLLTVLGIPGTLLEAAVDQGARALVERGGDVLSQCAPRHDVEERRLLLPFAVRLVAAVDGEAEAGHPAAAA